MKEETTFTIAELTMLIDAVDRLPSHRAFVGLIKGIIASGSEKGPAAIKARLHKETAGLAADDPQQVELAEATTLLKAKLITMKRAAVMAASEARRAFMVNTLRNDPSTTEKP